MANVETWNSYTLGVVLDTVVGKNLRIFPIMYKQFKHIAYCFFDIKQLSGENPGLTVAPKDIPGIEPSITVDGYSIKWLDYNTFDFSTEVKTAISNGSVSASGNSIVLKDNSGFAVNDTIYFKTDWTANSYDVDGTVTAVNSDGETVTVLITSINGVKAEASDTFKVTADQEVVRGYWTRNDNDEITRPSSVYNYVEFQSYIQHFSRRITFTKAELNKLYKYEGDAKAEATKRLNYNIGVMFQEINKALYKGRNIAPGAGNQKMEMLGLEEINRQKNTIHDLSSKTTGSEMLDAFYKIIEECQLSGSVASNDTITLLVNDRFLTELGRFREEKIRYDRVVDKLDMVLPTLATVYGDVELVRDPMLNTLYNYSVAFTLPKALVKLWTRENQEFNPKWGVTRADQSIHFYDVINNLREQKSYDMVWECGLIAGGMSAVQSPYHMIKNFAHKEDVVKTKEVA